MAQLNPLSAQLIAIASNGWDGKTKSLAEETGAPLRTVQRHVKRLKEHGLWPKKKRATKTSESGVNGAKEDFGAHVAPYYVGCAPDAPLSAPFTSESAPYDNLRPMPEQKPGEWRRFQDEVAWRRRTNTGTLQQVISRIMDAHPSALAAIDNLKDPELEFERGMAEAKRRDVEMGVDRVKARLDAGRVPSVKTMRDLVHCPSWITPAFDGAGGAWRKVLLDQVARRAKQAMAAD